MPRADGIPFGNYSLLRRIARGGMAEVFLARQGGLEGFHRTVAVKRILPHLVDSEEFVRMFLDEARLAARLTSPNIVHIYDFGKVDEHYFIAMEFVDGVHAGALIKQARDGQRMPYDLIARVGADACAGLRYAHNLTDETGRQLELVHRDVSPPNLMVTYDGVVKLVDFGIAKAVTRSEHTRPGVIKGKFAYMSPEQCTGQLLTGKSDVFSLGIVLWELVAGKVAVSRDDPVDGMKKIRDGLIPPIESVAPDVPAGIAYALRRALDVNPDRRASAAELSQSFEEFVKEARGLATNAELGEWIGARFPRANRTGEQPVLDGTRAAPTGTVQAVFGTVAAPDSVLSATISSTSSTTISSTMATEIAHTPPAGMPVPDDDVHDPPTEVVYMPTALMTGSALFTTGHHVATTDPIERERSRRPWLVAVIALAAIGVGTAALLQLRGSAAESTRPPTPPPQVPISVPLADATPPVVSAIAFDAAPPTDAAPARASLDISTVPKGARIVLDGEAVDVVTPARFDDLVPGAHVFELSLDGHEPLEREVTLAADERRTLELQLTPVAVVQTPVKRPPRKPGTGKVTIRTTPWSAVYFKGKKIGTTPFAGVKLPEGSHTLTFKNPGKAPHRRTVRVRRGKTTKLNFTLP